MRVFGCFRFIWPNLIFIFGCLFRRTERGNREELNNEGLGSKLTLAAFILDTRSYWSLILVKLPTMTGTGRAIT